MITFTVRPLYSLSMRRRLHDLLDRNLLGECIDKTLVIIDGSVMLLSEYIWQRLHVFMQRVVTWVVTRETCCLTVLTCKCSLVYVIHLGWFQGKAGESRVFSASYSALHLQVSWGVSSDHSFSSFHDPQRTDVYAAYLNPLWRRL